MTSIYWILLRDTLISLYNTHADALRIAHEAGMDVDLIAWDPRMRNTWHAILCEAEHQRRLFQIVTIACAEYPEHPILAWLQSGGSTPEEERSRFND